MFVCIENKEITAILSYEPNVPDTVEVVEISDNDYQKIVAKTHFFDTETNTVNSVSQEVIDSIAAEKTNVEHREFLSRTDWKVLRHIRQKALGIPTSLTEEEYLDLENQRQNAANSII